MFCSVIIPTIGRESLNKAVQSVLTQDVAPDDFEIIVVNDSGKPLSPQPWHTHPQVTLLNTYKRERVFARNSGAAAARGDYLWFLDDDDWLLPGAMAALRTVRDQHPEGVWLYGGIQVVDGEGNVLAELNSGLNGNCSAQVIGGAWVPIQTSLIKTQVFFEIGGFKPYILVTEDLDLCRRMALKGDFANTQAVIACLQRGESWETSTNYLRAAEDTLRSRDEVVSDHGAFQKLITSAKTPYWYGRIFRVYLSVALWNLRRRRLFSATDRGFWGLMSILFAGYRVFSKDYWQAVRVHHVPDTLHFVMVEYEKLEKE